MPSRASLTKFAPPVTPRATSDAAPRVRPHVALVAAFLVAAATAPAAAQAVPPEWRVVVIGPAVLAIGPVARDSAATSSATTSAPYMLRMIAGAPYTVRGELRTACPMVPAKRERTREFVGATGQVVAESAVAADLRRLVELVERSPTPDRLVCGQSLDAVHARHVLPESKVRALGTLEAVVADLRATRFDHGVLERIELRRALACAAIHQDFPQIVRRAGDRELLPRFIFAVEGTGYGTTGFGITEELRTESGITSALGISDWETLTQPDETRKLVQRCTRALDLELIAARF